jgi:hypothetical protein
MEAKHRLHIEMLTFVEADDRCFLPTIRVPHPHAFMLVVVGLAESPSMADDRVVPADRALPRQQAQWDHPGSTLSFASGSAIKRITAGVKARR